jgi:hypothetical protein
MDAAQVPVQPWSALAGAAVVSPAATSTTASAALIRDLM